jgi:hypothetical protein
MFRFIERNVLILLQWIGLSLAIVLFIAVIALGYISFNKINTTSIDKIDSPIIEFSNYKNFSNLATIDLENDIKVEAIEKDATKSDFDKKFNQLIAKISTSLEKLPDDVINKDDIQNKVEVLVKIKSNPYSQELQLAYAASLEKLTKQMEKIDTPINVDDFIKWHDQEFAFQVNSQKQKNAMRMRATTDNKINGYIALGLASLCLVIFMMLVMMFVLLRIERNTNN